MRVHPFYEVARKIELNRQQVGFDKCDAYQQFNCAKCGKKQTMDTPNVLYKSGKCEECGHITNIEEDGCNYMLHLHGPGDGLKFG